MLKWRDGVAYARQSGVPMPELLVPLSGLMAVGGGVLLALGLWPDLGALLLAAFIFPVAWMMHAFWQRRSRSSPSSSSSATTWG